MKLIQVAIYFGLLVATVSGVSVLLQNVDIARTGWNSKETNLTAANIPQLQLLGTIQTVTSCTTQLLYYENLNLLGHKNVLFCWSNPNRSNGTMTVYAFDADTFVEIWSLYIGQSSNWATEAPAIDPVTKHIYNVYKKDNVDGLNYLVGIDIMTGKMLPDSPKLLNATFPGTGQASVNGLIPFQNTDDPASGKRIHQDCRTSLLLINSVLYFAFGAYADTTPYHGWVLAYQYDTSKQQFVLVSSFCSTPNGGQGGIWMAGQGIASDGKYVYFNTGNGDFNPNKSDYSMGVLKLTLQLSLVDYFVPKDWQQYSANDWDVGGCGPALIPNTHYLVVGVTKYGAVHLIDINNMGKFNANKDACRQTVPIQTGFVPPGGNPVVWSNGNNAKVYLWGPDLGIVQLEYNSATEMFNLPFVRFTGVTGGGGLFITSNGVNDPILWAYGKNGGIYAFDATKDISAGPIWKANANGPNGWGWPLIVNGKVYTIGTKASIYGFK